MDSKSIRKVNVQEVCGSEPDSMYNILARTRVSLLGVLNTRDKLRVKLHDGQELPEGPIVDQFPNLSLFDMATVIDDIARELDETLCSLVGRL